MKIVRKSNLTRSIFFFKNKMVSLRMGTKFEKQFRKWYYSGTSITPNKIYDYIMNERN